MKSSNGRASNSHVENIATHYNSNWHGRKYLIRKMFERFLGYFVKAEPHFLRKKIPKTSALLMQLLE